MAGCGSAFLGEAQRRTPRFIEGVEMEDQASYEERQAEAYLRIILGDSTETTSDAALVAIAHAVLAISYRLAALQRVFEGRST